jgi:hypothetical protein
VQLKTSASVMSTSYFYNAPLIDGSLGLLVLFDWQRVTRYVLDDQVLDPSSHLQKVVGNVDSDGVIVLGNSTGGISGTSAPSWNDSGGMTTDGTIVWQDEGVAANEYLVPISLDPSWQPFLLPSGYTPYFRLYRRAIGTTPWILLADWQPNSLHFTDSASTSSPLRYQYSATWGDSFNPSNPSNPALHAEGVPGFYIFTADSTVEHTQPTLQVTDSLPLNPFTRTAYGVFNQRALFLAESVSDAIGFPVSLIERSAFTTTYATPVGARANFLSLGVGNEAPIADTVQAPWPRSATQYHANAAAPANMS